MSALNSATLAAALGFLPGAAIACASCGCTLSSDWGSQGFSAGPGLRLDARYDFLNQSQLHSGTGKVDRSAYPFPAAREIEQGTINRYATLALDYSPNADWGVNVQLPHVTRTHTTVAAGDEAISSSRSSSSGDARVIVRYQGFAETRNSGVQFGLKLPTGDFRRRFVTGPQAGEALDRGLQPGTGTTDLLFGAYHFDALNRHWDYFALGLAQVAINARNDYRPGTSLTLSGGVRYMSLESIVPQLQLNVRVARADGGSDADTPNSGGTLAYLSPGVTVDAAAKLKLYGFVQLPVYQNVRGFQLVPRWTASVGLRYEL